MVFVLAVLWSFVISLRSDKWGLFEGAFLLLGIYSLQVTMGLWYRISLRDGVIHQRAFGLPSVSIPLRAITSVGNRVSNAQKLLLENRPLRRLTIRGGQAGSENFIDVSLKHFVEEDIRSLIGAIRNARPDLVMPRGWT